MLQRLPCADLAPPPFCFVLLAALQSQANPTERKVIGIPSVVEKVKAAAPQKLDYGLDYYREFPFAFACICVPHSHTGAAYRHRALQGAARKSTACEVKNLRILKNESTPAIDV
jgi:hypothetical protein